MGDWADVLAAAIAAVAVAIPGVFAWKSLEQGRRTLYADVLLRLDQEMRTHQEVHVKLRSGGEWAGEGGPKDGEWPPLEAYMGLFERINFFIGEKLIDIRQVEQFYGYRYGNIVRNPVIHQQKLVQEKDEWEDFIELGKKLHQYCPRKYGPMT